ncbi:MAG: chromate transporter [Chloroflexi bacterium]|nr:chromate transporter [Chloroflexota bacterium]
MSAPPPKKPTPRAPLRQVAAAFFSIGATSFGGGRVVFFHDELVRRRGWLRDAEFLEGLALCQILPGGNIANLSAYLGQRLHGPLGALVAPLGLILPGALLMTLLCVLYFAGLRFEGAEAAFRGSGAAAVALVVTTLGRVAPRGLEARGGWLIAALTFAGIGLLQLNMLLVVPPVAALSIWLNRPQHRPSA